MSFKARSQVLCVDDDMDACEMLTVLMSTYGFDATCVPSAAKAWVEITRQTFDLYVLDGWLPVLDGFEFCRQIRETDASTPIIFYSGAAYDEDKRKGIAAGANAYITKPNVERLIATMSSLIAHESVPRSAFANVQPPNSASWFLPQPFAVEKV